jgi:DNA primase
MEYERLEFPEALRMLAKRAGVELTSRKQNKELSTQKERLYQINSLTKEYYHYVLTKHPAGKQALAYLKDREVNQKVIETFKLGYSPMGNALTHYLINKKKYTKEDLIAAGVAFQGRRDIVDFFRGRLMFPLIDHRDNVVGFSGRILIKDDEASKYVNTRETLIYHKGEHFYGINETKDAIRRANQAIIVEGEFDVISCFENGIANVVAVKGTALTESHVNLLGRFAQKVTFCFDGDKAGQEAIKKSLAVVEKKGLTPTVIEIPGGKDPDEILQSNPGIFKKAVDHDKNIYDYLFEKTLVTHDLTTAEGKKMFADQILPIIAGITNAIIKEHYLKKISSELNTSYEGIVKELAKIQQHQHHSLPAHKDEPQLQKRTKEEVLEEYLVALIIQDEKPKKALEHAMHVLADILPKERSYHKIMDHLLRHFQKESSFNGGSFGDTLPKELTMNYDTCFLLELPQFLNEKKVEEEITNTALQLRRIYIQKRLKDLAEEIKVKEKENNDEAVASLQNEYSRLLHSN